jgi:hypothetical protein
MVYLVQCLGDGLDKIHRTDTFSHRSRLDGLLLFLEAVITQYFPRAVGHLTEAGRASTELVAAWNGLLDAGLFDTGIVRGVEHGLLPAWMAR